MNGRNPSQAGEGLPAIDELSRDGVGEWGSGRERTERAIGAASHDADLPSVTVVILNYNGLRHLKDCFDSLLALQYPREKLELMLVDNASMDESVAFMRSHYPSVRIVQNDRNEGFAKGNNLGANAATGEYVAFFNNDTRVHPECLLALVRAIRQADETTVCAGAKILNWDGSRIDFVGGTVSFNGHAFQSAFGQPSADGGEERERPILFACGGAMLIRRDVYLSAGGFDDDYFLFFEDVDLGWRLWLFGYRVVYAPEALVYHRHHGSVRDVRRLDKLILLYERNALYTIYKNYGDAALKQVLPAVLALLTERAIVRSGLHPTGYHLDPAGPPARRVPPFDTAGPRQRSSLAKLRIHIQESGWLVAARVAARAAVVRLARKLGDVEVVSRTGVATLLAVPEFVSNLDRLREKRAAIQARRRRSDEEVFALFGEPFASNMPDDPEYMWALHKLAETWELDRLFGLPLVSVD